MAEVLIFEDAPEHLILLHAMLGNSSQHTIEREAHTRQDALICVEELRNGKIQVDPTTNLVMLLDGNLQGSRATDGSDAEAISQAIEEADLRKQLGLWVVGFSNRPMVMWNKDIKVDTELTKVNVGKVVETLDKIDAGKQTSLLNRDQPDSPRRSSSTGRRWRRPDNDRYFF